LLRIKTGLHSTWLDMNVLIDEDLLLEYRRMSSERANGNKREEQGGHNNHSCKYRNKDSLPFAFSLAMWCTWLPILLPTLEAENLA
jgi:hypothetical protein